MRVLDVLALCVVVGGAAVLMTCAGCANPIADQARAATVTAGVLSAGDEAVSEARSAALSRVEERFPHDPEHDAQLDLEAARWRPVGQAFDEARTALLAWVDALELAQIAGGGEDLLLPIARVAARAVQLIVHALDLARTLGVEDLPAIPPLVLTFTHASEGAR